MDELNVIYIPHSSLYYALSMFLKIKMDTKKYRLW